MNSLIHFRRIFLDRMLSKILKFCETLKINFTRRMFALRAPAWKKKQGASHTSRRTFSNGHLVVAIEVDTWPIQKLESKVGVCVTDKFDQAMNDIGMARNLGAWTAKSLMEMGILVDFVRKGTSDNSLKKWRILQYLLLSFILLISYGPKKDKPLIWMHILLILWICLFS